MAASRPSLASRTFTFVLLLSLPLYAAFLLIGLGILPETLAFALIPVATIAPLFAGLFTTPPGHRRTLLRRAMDWNTLSHRGWLVPGALLVPTVLALAMVPLLALGVSANTEGQAPLAMVPVLTVAFLIAAAAEELGWMGVAYGSLVSRMGRVGATTTLALVWVLWHVPFYVTTFSGILPILAHSTTVVALRFVMVWFYERGGRSVFLVILIHTSFNVALAVVPVYSMAEPLGMGAVACLMVTVAGGLWATGLGAK